MKHAILGAGGVGGFVGAILGQAGHDVTLVLRQESLASHPEALTLESPLGAATTRVTKTVRLAEPVDVLWVTVKATQLVAASASVDTAGPRAVVPLLNGVDHVALLRARFGDRVVAATIAGEFERLEPGRIIHRSRLARLAVHAPGERLLAPATAALTAFGCRCDFIADEATLLWSKLVVLGPFALTTTAAAAPIGVVRDDPAWRPRLEACAREACRVAAAAGARLDEDATVKLLHTFEPSMRSSMQKDVAAGRPPELDAIAGPILRGGAGAGIPVPATTALADLVSRRSRSLV